MESYLARLQALKGRLEAEPQKAANWLAYAEEMLKACLLAEASQVIRQAREIGHDGKQLDQLEEKIAHLRLAAEEFVQLLEAGAVDALEPRVLDWIENRPYDPFGWKILGALYSNQGKYDLAIAPLTRAVDLNPGDAEARVNLANTLHEQGNIAFGRARWAEAEAYYRSANEYIDDDKRQVNIAACLYQQGQFAEAEWLSLDVLERLPNFAEALNTLGAVYNETNRFDQAESALRRALELRPDYVEALMNLGIALKEKCRFDDAQAALRQALTLQPNNAHAYVVLADTFDRETRIADAQQAFETALAHDPRNVRALHGLGALLITRGQFDAAEVLLRQALAIAPEEPAPWTALAHLRKMSRDDRAWFASATALAKTSMRPVQKIALNFAIGKAYDDVGDYEAAFGYYKAGNEEAKELGPRYDPQKQTERTEAICETFSAARLQKPSPAASKSARPLFIVGMPRSGTSLTEQIIASHPATYGAGELRFWRLAATRCEPLLPGQALDDRLIKMLADECLSNLDLHSRTALHVVDKMPGNFNHLGLIHSVFPQARILHTQRNPVDTCLSIYFQNFSPAHTYAKDLGDLAHRYREYHRLMKHWRDVLPPGVLLDLPYEALIENQEGWTRKIIEFIGLEWDDACLDFHKTERRVGTASNWQARQPIYKTSKERWRNYEKYLGPLLPLLDLYDPAKGQI